MISLGANLAYRVQWDSDVLLANLHADDFKRTSVDVVAYRPILWNDLCSEYDAVFFYNCLEKVDFRLTDEFAAALPRWRVDEDNHYRGLRRIYPLLYDESLEEVSESLRRRRPDFTPLTEFMSSELSLCLLLAFDEIASLRSYVDDFKFYDSFIIPELSEWIRRVARDESCHYNEFVMIIGQQHADSALRDAESIVERIVSHDATCSTYGATFVLDHTGPQFTKQFLEDCATTLLRAVYYRARQTTQSILVG